MRVLVASARAPAEPQNGFTVRVAGMLTALARNHDVRLVAYGRSCSLGGASGVEVSLVDPPDEAGPATRMAARVTAATTGEPALLRSYRKGKLASAVEEAVDAAGDRPDVVHFAGLGAAHVAAHLLRGAPRVLDLVDAWHLEAETSASTALTPASRAAWRRRATMIRRFEARAIQRCDLAIASAWRDVDALRPLAGSVPLAVVGNGVDTEHFAPGPGVEALSGLLAFHGTLDFAPNVDAARALARDILPLVREQMPGARVRLIGRRPAPAVLGLAGPGVEVMADVADVRTALLEAQVAVCPVRLGSGVKNKILEAAALGLPLVTTRAALGDLELEDGREVLLGETADELAAASIRLLRSPRLRAELSHAARERVLASFRWDQIADQLTALYTRLAAPR